jgi:AcrR family transcriptional regulator
MPTGTTASPHAPADFGPAAALSWAGMPAPPKTSDAEIVGAARQLLEQRGRDGFSMNDVASAVGVRAPSLYGRFADRAALLGSVEQELWRDLGRALAGCEVPRSPVRTLTAQAHAYRAFAKANPKGYSLLFDCGSGRSDEDTRARAAALAPSMPAFAALVGEERALSAARVLTPFLHGFVSMEIAGAFRLAGGLDAAFEHGVATILRGLARPQRPRRASSSKKRAQRA